MSFLEVKRLIPRRILYDCSQQDTIFNDFVTLIQENFRDRIDILDSWNFLSFIREDIIKAMLLSFGLRDYQNIDAEYKRKLLANMVSWLKTRTTDNCIISITRNYQGEPHTKVYEPFYDAVRLSVDSSLSTKFHFTDSDYYRPGTYDVLVREFNRFSRDVVLDTVLAGTRGYYTLLSFAMSEPYDMNLEYENVSIHLTTVLLHISEVEDADTISELILILPNRTRQTMLLVSNPLFVNYLGQYEVAQMYIGGILYAGELTITY